VEHLENVKLKCGEVSTFQNRYIMQGGHSPGEPWKHGKVREFKTGQEKVRKKRKSQGKCVLTYGQLPRVL